MMGTRKKQKLARKKAKMDQIRKGKAHYYVENVTLLISPDKTPLNLSIRRWGKRGRGSFRDKKERYLIFRGQMNSNKESIVFKGVDDIHVFISLKNLRGMWGKRSGETHYLRQPDNDPSVALWRNWRSEF